MNDELVSQVEDLGLSQKEARVYVASLMLGPSSVQKIADFAGIKRVTTYVILEALINLGLISQTTKGKKAFFNAEDPTNLRRLTEKKQQELTEQQENLESILPQLESLKSLPSDSPSVKFYDGPGGIRSIFNDNLESMRRNRYDTVYGISNLDDVYSFFPDIQSNRSNPERVKLGVRSRFLYTSKSGPVLEGSDDEFLRESRWVPADKYSINGDINILGNTVVLANYRGTKPVGVLIESTAVTQMMLAIFELAWQAAAPYNQKK